ncbi:MAG: hypothetical protein JW776_04120 [Candidatus Lokiarchaeota archaeon]|nr:hypothetical protein [Candidatus Lokiarchaeota archaeon]
MKLYVFETDKWLESDNIYPHDIAICLVSDAKKIYVWEGNRATLNAKKQAHESLSLVLKKFPQYSFHTVDSNTPSNITQFIETYLNTRFEEVEKIDRDPQYVIFLFLLFGLFVGLGVGYIMLLRIIAWNRVPGYSLLVISESAYSAWIQQNIVVFIILAGIFTIALVFASLTKKVFLIVTASVGIVILTGTILYIRLGVYLFDFKAGAPIGYYYISIGAVIAFFFLNLLALGFIITPMVISVNAILKTTTPITWNQWLKKRKKTVLEMKKFSILDMVSEFTEIEESTDEKPPSEGEDLP